MLLNHRVTVIGVGRLGLCLSLCLERAGFEVMGVDILPDYARQLNEKTFRSAEPRVTEFLRNSLHFTATTSLKEGLNFASLCFIVLPAHPQGDSGSYDPSHLLKLLSEIDALQVTNKHFVICTPVSPNTFATFSLPSCQNVTINYNPLFVAKGNLIEKILSPDVIVIGEESAKAGETIERLYRRVCGNVEIVRMSPKSAEITMLAINSFISMKIVFANLIGEAADETAGADKEAILRAIGKDQRVGSKYLKAGYGYGGPSIPRDTRVLNHYISSLGLDAGLLQAVDRTNDSHAEWIASQLSKQELEEYIFEDVSYKSNCPYPETKESPKLAVASKLATRGKKVVILDTEGVIVKVQQEYPDLFSYSYKEEEP